MFVLVDAYFITLTITTYEIVPRDVRVGRETRTQHERKEIVREIATHRDETSLRRTMVAVNSIWAQAGIEFRLNASRVEKVAAPSDAEAVDPNTFGYLARKFPPQGGVSLLLVAKFDRGDLGGQAVEEQRVCILGDAAPATSLAHEFGHLLHLDHEGDGRNLMNPGLSVPQPALTPKQIKTAQGSTLAKKYGAPAEE